MSKTQQTAGEKPRIGEQEVRRAAELLKKYRQGKVNLERFEAARKVHDRIVMGTKRASSLVENVNSRLRAYMNIKKCVSDSFYSLVQLHLNTKKYRRSRVKSRQGRSPVEIMTGESWPELIDLLEERVFWSSWNRRKAA